MIDTKTHKAVEKARKIPIYMRSSEFIHTRLFDYDLHTMLLEMGPNCNLNCFHCLDSCGPKRNGLPSPSTLEKAMANAVRASVLRACLTSGEPLREENKEAVAATVYYSQHINTNIVTNATFASSLDNAIHWLLFLKDKGFDLSDKANHLCVSLGRMYPTTQDNFRYLNDALRVVYPDANLGNNLFYEFIGLGEISDTIKRVNELIVTINESFGKRRSERMGKLGAEDAVYVYPSKGKPLRIAIAQVEPYGRALNLPLFKRIMPVKRLGLGDLLMEHEPVGDFHVFYNGDVHFSDCKGVLGRSEPYGNVTKEHLGIILHRMRMDPLFQGFKLGGTPLLYFAAQKIDSNFEVVGRTNYDVSRAIFGNSKLKKEVRTYLSKNGVVDSYRKFVNTADLRQSGFHPKEYIHVPQNI